MGNLYLADPFTHSIRKITPEGMVTTFAGGEDSGYRDGPVATALFTDPYGIVVDATGNIYVADNYDHRIRKIISGVVSTLAGSGEGGYVNGTGIGAQFWHPHGIVVDANGNVYVADQGNQCIRKITPAGVVTTFARNETAGNNPTIWFNLPTGLAIDAAGNLYVAEQGKSRIYKITPSGIVTQLAGGSDDDDFGYANGTGTEARFHFPVSVAVNATGSLLYVADNQRIRKIVVE